MKVFSTLLLALLFTAGLLAQNGDELLIPAGEPGILNQTIFGDTTDTGERVNPNRIYILQRGVPYVITESMRWEDFHIHLRAEEGDGPRPLIIYTPGAGGESISQVFRLQSGANLTMEGIHLTGRDILGNVALRGIRINGDQSRVIIDDCIIEEVGQAIFRLQADSIKLYVTNSIIQRAGNPTDPNNGRVMDNRGNPMDTIWFENNLIYAVTSRIYRPGGSMPYIHNGIFNQNTIWGTGQHGFNLGQFDNVSITNNVVANTRFLPFEVDDPGEYAVEIDTFIPGQTDLLVSHNNFYVADAFANAIPATAPNGDVLVSMRDSVFGPFTMMALNETATEATNISEPLNFADAPPVPVQFIEAVAADTAGTDDGVEGAGPWDFSDLTPDMTWSGLTTGVDRYSEFHDFSYPDDAVSATAGTEGQALGASFDITSSTIDLFAENNVRFYPNPARDFLFIYNLQETNLEQIVIFNMLGQVVQMERVTEQDFYQLDISNLDEGMYLLSLYDRNGQASARKFIKQ